MKSFLRFLLRFLYGYRAYRTEALTTPGPVLLLPNHVSWLDWLFLMVLLDDDWKCVVSMPPRRLRGCIGRSCSTAAPSPSTPPRPMQ